MRGDGETQENQRDRIKQSWRKLDCRCERRSEQQFTAKYTFIHTFCTILK